jgi:hypothetical protein
MIWIDITNLPHVPLFKETILREGAWVTTRRSRGLIPLLRLHGVPHRVVGRHGGRGREGKLLESTRRSFALARLLLPRAQEMEAAISKHSVELPRVAFGLGIPVLQFVDNEFAEHQNRLFLPLCHRVLVPRAVDHRRLREQGALPSRVRRFRGLCEVPHVRTYRAARRDKTEPSSGGYVLVRPVPIGAAYFRGRNPTQELIDALREAGHRVLVFPRGGERYRGCRNVRTLRDLSLIARAKALVGGGGTMNREGALLGVPTLSFYSGDLLGVDRFLLREGLLFHTRDPEELLGLLPDLMEAREELRRRAHRLLGRLEDPAEVLAEELNSVRGRSS